MAFPDSGLRGSVDGAHRPSILDEHSCFMRPSGASLTRRDSGEASSPRAELLMAQRSTAASPQASLSGYGSGVSTPAGTPTAPKKAFGISPQSSSSPMGASCHYSTLTLPIPDPRGVASNLTRCCWVQPMPRDFWCHPILGSGIPPGHCSSQSWGSHP